VNRRTYTDQQLREAVQNSTSIRQVLRHLNLAEAGGNYQTVQQRIKQLGIDISHLEGQAWRKGSTQSVVPPKSLTDLLQLNVPCKSHILKERLIKAGFKQAQCECCGNKEWLGNPIPLELHHVNGNRADNRLENLQLLCPNCHALTKTYRGRNIRRRAEL
jgi:hypothetical protein